MPPTTHKPLEPLDVVDEYHDRTMHWPGRPAASLGYMDWDTQPDPFRTFSGAPRVPLALRDPAEGPSYGAAMVEGAVAPAPLSHAALSQLFQDALGLSAWKAVGEHRWALRVNPSSGNLHPTEGYLVCGAMPGVSDTPGVYHYQPHDHVLERRRELSYAAWEAIAGQLPPGAVLVGLSSIYVRESWKYGERAFRYCQHDVGHALAAVAVAAAGLGWSTRLLDSVTDPQLAALLGTDAQQGPEAEHPDLLAVLFPQGADWPIEAWRSFQLPPIEGPPLGTPAPLASDHQPWPAIDAVHAATIRPRPPGPDAWDARPVPNPALAAGNSDKGLRAIAHQRRSAVDMDGRTGIVLGDFVLALARTLPGAGQVPLCALPWRAQVHLLVFVHRVQGLAPGLYLLVRDPAALPTLKVHVAPEAPWTPAEVGVEGFPLYRLSEGDVRGAAASLSCGQSIASDGVFAVAMLAGFEGPLADRGPSFYKRLHWEAGLIGQLLYLEAEVIGIRGTGIGCFYDDGTHRGVGVGGRAYRDLYHFTVGGPVDDGRLQTLAPYGHLER